MKASRSINIAKSESPSDSGPVRAWTRFWFSATDPVALHLIRTLSGLLFLAWLLPFAGHLDALFGLQGWFDQQAYSDITKLVDAQTQPISWSML